MVVILENDNTILENDNAILEYVWRQTRKKRWLQLDARGRNFLHLAIEKTDIESVLFLLSVRANVNSPVQDAAQLTPLHLAVKTGSEILVRNMVSGRAADVITRMCPAWMGAVRWIEWVN